MKEKKISVYIPSLLDGYEFCHPINQDDFENINVQVNGLPRVGSWKPIVMRIIREDEGRKLLESDSPWLGSHALMFRSRATDVLGPMMRDCGELLPIACNGADISLFNPTRVIDALDEAASSVLRFSDKQIMRINRHVFRSDAIRDVHFFKIPNLRVSPTFVSEHVVELWKTSGLRGLEFKQVWSSR
ncbi:MAG TPA: DUF1629 domain-containing protein [Archangium sp.]|uniref:imm11 family protein n=1 Tax=Archangium sp. TaxID=1872627 RepID=UPI002E30F831|nr:DUF1629 domain-containing protein [Archangium sp.]HEX5749059.1 DUF1629 domain-containing protein [Archangium sp.]